jgi:hypothetical protein
MTIEGRRARSEDDIRSSDFSELDRLAYNFAHSAGKNDFDAHGLGGNGTITAR